MSPARWIVDGMNVIGSRPTGWWRDRPRAMRELVDELRTFGEPVTVVFDGKPFEIEDTAQTEVLFASRRGRNAADDDIAALVAAADDPAALQVVTSDSELADPSTRARRRGGRSGRLPGAPGVAMTDAASNGYEVALLDWLGCAARGRQEEAAEAARGVEDRLVFAATAGHVLDFDDTYLPGLAHLSAPVAPAALVLAAELKKTTGDALAAYIRGFEAMGALARASHPALYDRGWHPTAVCGAAGAAVAASHLIDAPVEAALAIALLQGGGLRAAFGSHGKSLQVGLAAASGVQAARLARAGARVPLETAARGWEQATGGTFARPGSGQAGRSTRTGSRPGPAVCRPTARSRPPRACAATTRRQTSLTVTVHPVSLQAAAEGPEPADGLQAKFSIPYLTAFTLLHGPPEVESFDAVDRDAIQRAQAIEIKTDSDLLESECVLERTGTSRDARVKAALGSPGHPMDAQALRAKLQGLLGAEPPPTLDQDEPAERLLQRFGL